MTQIVALVPCMGGVGATTIARGLTRYWRESEGHRVLLVDLQAKAEAAMDTRAFYAEALWDSILESAANYDIVVIDAMASMTDAEWWIVCLAQNIILSVMASSVMPTAVAEVVRRLHRYRDLGRARIAPRGIVRNKVFPRRRLYLDPPADWLDLEHWPPVFDAVIPHLSRPDLAGQSGGKLSTFRRWARLAEEILGPRRSDKFTLSASDVIIVKTSK